MYTIVYKLGGSLLTLPDLPRRLQALLKQPLPFPEASQDTERLERLLVVGGGPIADVVRRWDDVYGLGDSAAHDLAMQSMSFNAQLAAAILSGAQVVTTRAEARDAWAQGCVAVLAAAEFVDAEERSSDELLPRSWDVTSDSVAAYVALHWPADALVMLKSVPLPVECDTETSARGNCVDAYFPHLASRVPQIGWANLRSDVPPAIQTWRCNTFRDSSQA
jgi:5-(aminomethyl)-3-furanmethanol phosphate kinase